MGESVFDSYNQFFKEPFGAVTAGTGVRLRLAVPREQGVSRPCLLWYPDGESAAPRSCPMAPAGEREGRDVFETVFTPAAPGLYFYYFDLYRDYQKLFQGEWGNAVQSTTDGKPYQLTVYDPAFAAPAGWAGGVLYQIFPDRFCEGRPDKTMPFADRIYRTDKKGEPYWWPNEVPDGHLNQDYFGGDLAGIRQKLPYLVGLGVTAVYLNPIFEAHSNHRYNTADYTRVDPVLGTNEEFAALCRAAHEKGIRVILDGVFSHTGSDSVYFDREGRYGSGGAWHNPTSPYRSWYDFSDRYSCGYRSWWGFPTLPEVNEEDASYRDFICGENGVLRTWLRRGADGWRLDVADELPDSFLSEVRRAVKAEGAEKLLLGEVWEDATTKVSYGTRRPYLLGTQLDGVMNYPWRAAVLDFLRTGDGLACDWALMEICDRYPAPALAVTMNLLGTHDTERAVTALAGEPLDGHDRAWQSARHLSPERRSLGKKLLRLAFALEFFLPGMPCVYYGDEIAMEGYRDPFNRAFYDWDDPETALRRTVCEMAAARRESPALHDGVLTVLAAGPDMLALRRQSGGAEAVLLLNRALRTEASVDLPWGGTLSAGPLRWALSLHSGE